MSNLKRIVVEPGNGDIPTAIEFQRKHRATTYFDDGNRYRRIVKVVNGLSKGLGYRLELTGDGGWTLHIDQAKLRMVREFVEATAPAPADTPVSRPAAKRANDMLWA